MSSKDPLSKIRAGDVYKNLVRILKEFGVPDADWSIVDRRPHPQLTVRYCGLERTLSISGTPSSRFTCRNEAANLRRLLKEMQMASLGAPRSSNVEVAPVTVPSASLVYVGVATIAGREVPSVSARELHAFLGNGDRFTSWIRDRVRQYGFAEGIDFVTYSESAEKGAPRIEFTITLDMAKELSMVERTVRGQEARRYFISCEADAIAARSTGGFASLPPDVRREIGGIVKSVIHRELSEIIPQMVEQRLLAASSAVVNMVPALTVVQWAGVNDRRGLRGLSNRVSNALRRFHADRGIAVQTASLASECRYVFDPATSRQWLDEGGRRTIQRVVAEKQGQLRLAVA